MVHSLICLEMTSRRKCYRICLYIHTGIVFWFIMDWLSSWCRRNLGSMWRLMWLVSWDGLGKLELLIRNSICLFVVWEFRKFNCGNFSWRKRKLDALVDCWMSLKLMVRPFLAKLLRCGSLLLLRNHSLLCCWMEAAERFSFISPKRRTNWPNL